MGSTELNPVHLYKDTWVDLDNELRLINAESSQMHMLPKAQPPGQTLRGPEAEVHIGERGGPGWDLVLDATAQGAGGS